MDIAKHLEVLLLSNDCVAIPDFGGFVAYYVSAHVDEADGTFLPPMRTIGFNPQLKMNDSLLAQSYVEAYDISYPEALRRIEQEVESMKHQMMHDGSCLLEGIGTLTSNDEGNYCFSPGKSGLLTPAIYGLDSFEFTPLAQVSVDVPKSVTRVAEPIAEKDSDEVLPQHDLLEIVETEEDEEEHAISIKMSWIRSAVAVAAAIILFFLLTTPVANSNFGSQTMSALQNSFIHKLMPKDSNMMPATPVATKKIVAKSDIKKDSMHIVSDTHPQQTLLPVNAEKPYCLVLASQVKRSNAEEFVRILREKGFKDTGVYIHNNVVRVVYGHFNSENDAYIELHNLRFEEYFEEAWVYKRKTEG